MPQPCTRTSSAIAQAIEGQRITRLPTLARITVVALSLASILLVIVVAIGRIGHPYELEWLEGTMADHMLRVMNGQQIYAAPSTDFVAFIYPPLYYWLCAGVAALTGPDLFPMRIVALAATLGCFAMVGWIVRRETSSTVAAIAAAGLFAAAFAPGGAWFDLARVDSLFIFLVLVAAALVRFGSGHASSVAAGLVMCIALLTKQSAVMLAMPLVVYLLVYNRPRAVSLVVTFAITAIASHVILNAQSDGWYGWYVWQAPARQSYTWPVALAFWIWDLPRTFALTMVGALAYFVTSPRRGNPQLVFYFLFTGALIGASWLHRIHKGGFANVLLLAYVALAILGGLAIAKLLADNRDSTACTALVCAAIVLQLVMHTFDPRNYIPGSMQRDAWSAIVERVRAVDGPVWLPMHGYVATQAGKQSGAHVEAVYAAQMTGDTAVTNVMRRSIVAALESSHYEMIIADRSMESFCRDEGLGWLLESMHRNYVVSDTITSPDESLMPYTGARTRPELIYTRRTASTAAR